MATMAYDKVVLSMGNEVSYKSWLNERRSCEETRFMVVDVSIGGGTRRAFGIMVY